MKRLVLKLVTILVYIFLLLYVLKFDVRILFGLKEILFTILGTLILSISYLNRTNKMHELCGIIGRNALVTSYITTFILLFTRMSEDIGYDNLLADIALGCRPILYGFIIYILLRREDEYTYPLKESTENGKTICVVTVEQLYKKLSGLGLTKREVELAVCIYNSLSNREIAEELYISETTVKKHVSHIFEKLSITTREQIKDMIRVDSKEI